MLGAALTTAQTFAATSPSAATRSRSTWSMIAMSPGRSRLVRRLVRRSRRATPTTPGWRSPLRERRRVASLIAASLPDVLGEPDPAAPPSGVPLRGRGDGQQLLRVTPRELRVGQPGEHPRQLFEPVRAVDPPYAGRRHGAVIIARDDQVVVGES